MPCLKRSRYLQLFMKRLATILKLSSNGGLSTVRSWSARAFDLLNTNDRFASLHFGRLLEFAERRFKVNFGSSSTFC